MTRVSVTRDWYGGRLSSGLAGLRESRANVTAGIEPAQDSFRQDVEPERFCAADSSLGVVAGEANDEGDALGEYERLSGSLVGSRWRRAGRH